MSMETLDAATAAATPTGASAEAIQHHYDVGNAFYALWLDSTMTYSSALWHRDDEDLETAQRNKLDWHLARAGSAGARRLLDVGCGWGGLIRRALQGNPDCHCTGLTLSREQHAFLGGLDPHRVDVRLESWADHQALAPYDGIVSIGAFEHFARLDQSREEKIAGYRDFFRFCSRNLVEGGHVSLQTIVYETRPASTSASSSSRRSFRSPICPISRKSPRPRSICSRSWSCATTAITMPGRCASGARGCASAARRQSPWPASAPIATTRNTWP